MNPTYTKEELLSMIRTFTDCADTDGLMTIWRLMDEEKTLYVPEDQQQLLAMLELSFMFLQIRPHDEQ